MVECINCNRMFEGDPDYPFCSKKCFDEYAGADLGEECGNAPDYNEEPKDYDVTEQDIIKEEMREDHEKEMMGED